LFGDPIYGKPAKDPSLPDRLMLHAWRLSFDHPITGIPQQAAGRAETRNQITKCQDQGIRRFGFRIVINLIAGHVGKLLGKRPAKQQHGTVSDFIDQRLQRAFTEDFQIGVEETFGVLFHGK
jgi:hypothetical protein